MSDPACSLCVHLQAQNERLRAELAVAVRLVRYLARRVYRQRTP